MIARSHPESADASAKRVIHLPVLPSPPAEEVEALRAEVAEGMLYAHYRANANTSRTLETAAFSYALIELLAERGVITIAELDERKKIVAERLEARYRDSGMGVMRQEAEADKYAFGAGPAIDCASRLHVCRAACCRLAFALSRQDVEEGVLKWEFGRPYMIRRAPDGYCTHLEREGEGGCRCGVYAHRPYPCRAYDCRGDARIWADFEAMVPSPELERLFAVPRDGEPPAEA
ncbi:MAG TPA: YkgJ family cysteine cluster protein [Longimicrobium sp.]